MGHSSSATDDVAARPGTLYRVSLPHATFGLIAGRDVVVRAAPIARWAVGRDVVAVLTQYERKGAQIERMSA